MASLPDKFPYSAVINSLPKSSARAYDVGGSTRFMEAPLPPYIGPYRVVRKLGEGGMGAVFQAVQAPIERAVAVKTLHSSHARNEPMVARFLNEAKALGKLQHPNVVQVIDYGTSSDGTPYLVMEFLRGESLAKRLKTYNERRAVLPFLTVLHIGFQVADALSVAHASGIVHRDLKPDNLMLVPDAVAPGGERVKILDFGIAKLTDQDLRNVRTATHTIMGTPMYMSPEQCQGAGRVDAKTDVYSLGCLLYEALCGVPPFLGEGNGEIIAKHLFQEPVPIRTLASTVPAPIAGLVHRMLLKDKSQRPSMTKAADELGAIISGLSNSMPLFRTPATQSYDPDATMPRVAPPKTLGNARGQLGVLVEVIQQRWVPFGSLALIAVILLSVVGWNRAVLKQPSGIVSTERPKVAGRAVAHDKSQEQPSSVPPNQTGGAVEKSTSLVETPNPSTESKSPFTVPATDAKPESSNVADTPSGGRTKSTHLPNSTSGTSTFSVSISGADGETAKILRNCATSELKSVRGLPESYQVHMARSGALHVVAAPPQIYHTELHKCIRNGLKTLPVPSRVTLSIRSGH